MREIQQTLRIEATGNSDSIDFLAGVGDRDLLRFLRRLPTVWGQDNDEMTLSDLIYEMQLWPFVKQAWTEVKGSPGLPGRLAQIVRVYERAEAEFQRETGKTRRQPRAIDFGAFVRLYSEGGLP